MLHVMVTNDEFHEDKLHGIPGPREYPLPEVGDIVVIDNEKTWRQKFMTVVAVNTRQHTYDLVSKVIGGKNGR